MNEQQQQAAMMNQQGPPQMMSMNQMSMSQPQMMNPQVMNQKKPSQMMFNRSRNNLHQLMMNNVNSSVQIQQPPPQMMNRSYGMWPLPDQLKFSNPNANPNNPPIPMSMKAPQVFVSGVKQSKPLGPRNNWKGKKVNNKMDKRKDGGGRRPEKALMGGSTSGGGLSIGYKPPTLHELQHQNRVKARRFFPKRKFYNHNSNNNMGNMSAPFAPRNTTSFLIRAKKSGGIASLVSPCPVTPAVLPTPIFSPSREVLVDMAKEEWGVDGYGSMKGLIRLRSPGHEVETHEDEDEDEGGSSESDVEEHVEVERRLDHDLSRFEMIYPNYGGPEYNNVLENRVDDQDTHIAQLEEENLILKERLFLMERELGDLRRRLQSLERQNNGGEEINEEVVENESESGSHGEAHSMDENNEEFVEENMEGDEVVKAKEEVDSEGEAKPTNYDENQHKFKDLGYIKKDAEEANNRKNVADVQRLDMTDRMEDETQLEQTELNCNSIQVDVEASENITTDDMCTKAVAGADNEANPGIQSKDQAA